MIKQLTQLEHVIGDKVYHFTCDPNSPISEVRDALYKFLGYMDVIEKKSAELSQQNSSDNPVNVIPSEKQEIKNV